MAFNLSKAYNWVIATCKNAYVGYSMTYRVQGKVTSGGHTYTFYDCSSLMYYALKYGGASTSDIGTYPFATGGEASALTKAGWHKVSAPYKAGDIGLRSTHTEMCYKGGSTISDTVWMGAHTNHSDGYRANISDPNFDSQVSINTYKGQTWSSVWRYGDGGAEESSSMSAYVVAAICGCWWRESQVNAGIWESLTPVAWTATYSNHTGGYGFGQLTNTNGDSHGRLYQFRQWMVENGYGNDMTNSEAQLEYIFNVEKLWHNPSSSSYSSLADFLASTSTNLNSLVSEFLAHWEGVPGNALSERQAYARKVYNYITEHADDNVQWTSGNRYLSENETLNNCVLVYRWLGGYGGGGENGDAINYHKMPVWMMINYHL